MKRLVVVCCALALVVGLASLVTAASSGTAVRSEYAMRDLGTFGGTASVAYGINDRGQVVVMRGKGATEAAQKASSRSLVWEDGKVRWLGTLAGGATTAHAINASGQVAGLSIVGGLPHAFLWQNGKMRDLGAVGGNMVVQSELALNDRAEVVGARVLKNGVASASGAPRAFLWRQKTMLNLGKLGATYGGSAAYGINERSQVVGVSTGFGRVGSEGRAFLWQSGTMRDIATPTKGVLFAWAFAINDRSQVAGICRPAVTPAQGEKAVARPCLWQQGTITVLATLAGAPSSAPNAINNKGQVVGFVTSARGTPRAVIWEKGKVTELGAGNTWARAINEHGQIVGAAVIKGNVHAVLWTNDS